jgi:hypothetical protein
MSFVSRSNWCADRWVRAGAVALVLGVSGCTNYVYDVVKPTIETPVVGKVDDVVFTAEPVRYRMRVVDNRLVIRVFNATMEPVELVGTRSAIVDPSGQSRPVRGQTIPPGAFAKLILPPIRPEFVSDTGFRLESSSGGYGPGLGRSEFGYDSPGVPTEYRLRDGGEFYWEWTGDGPARVILVFVHEGKETTQELVFSRRKAE